MSRYDSDRAWEDEAPRACPDDECAWAGLTNVTVLRPFAVWTCPECGADYEDDLNAL